GLATVQTIEEDGLLEHSLEMSARFGEAFDALREELPIIREVRRCGMMIGLDLTIPSTPAVGKCMEKGLLINATHDTVVRLLPPMNVTAEQVDTGCSILADVLRDMAEEAA
ncbi:MAG: aminotransferase class III-fold pyridoxal phosphate-dependent enzyme, partial [Planctomycetaceae bacterium]|nr:aminotransferase class III-fold pyridoxal phosphate-dependent enzyme [Planctomycetaceae bacterium]